MEGVRRRKWEEMLVGKGGMRSKGPGVPRSTGGVWLSYHFNRSLTLKVHVVGFSKSHLDKKGKISSESLELRSDST